MSFDVAADAYDRFMGRFSVPLSEAFADFVGVQSGSALDVGCGTGALTSLLVERLGEQAVSAVDPSESFVGAARARFPRLDVRVGSAERLPFDDGSFDAALAQLVVHFMADPVSGLREMARVTRRGGVVGACVWDHGGGGGPLSSFWRAVRTLDPTAPGEADLPGSRGGHLSRLATEAGLVDVEESMVAAYVPFGSFEEWWEPFTLGVGPAGDYVSGLDAEAEAALKQRLAEDLPEGGFVVEAAAWTVRAKVS